MKLVVDANILFSLFIKSSRIEELVFDDSLEMYAPEFIFEEFQIYEEYIISKTQRTSLEFQTLLHILKKRINIIPLKNFSEYIQEAKNISPDINDIQYFALALKLQCPLWSNDKKLKTKQHCILVYSSQDLINIFLC
jgi:predicted nucleic acid-binding protein